MSAMPLWCWILVALAVGSLLGFFAGVQFGSSQRELNRLQRKELKRLPLNPEAASDAAEEGR